MLIDWDEIVFPSSGVVPEAENSERSTAGVHGSADLCSLFLHGIYWNRRTRDISWQI